MWDVRNLRISRKSKLAGRHEDEMNGKDMSSQIN